MSTRKVLLELFLAAALAVAFSSAAALAETPGLGKSISEADMICAFSRSLNSCVEVDAPISGA